MFPLELGRLEFQDVLKLRTGRPTVPIIVLSFSITCNNVLKDTLVFPLEGFIHWSNYRPETQDVLDLETF